VVNLTSIGFKIAFGVNDYYTGKPLDDPNFVTWNVRLNEIENQKTIKITDIKYHKCTDKDYDDFYPPGPNYVKAI